MTTFLQETLHQILHKDKNISEAIIILPSKRAGGFFKNYLKNATEKTLFAPTIISIEEFIESVANLKILRAESLQIKSYEAYQNTFDQFIHDSFEQFNSWASTVLNDFNEIDRYLVDAPSFFSYLESIKTLEQWGVQQQSTPMIDQFLSLWKRLADFYQNLQELLLSEKLGYQGMVYRKAAEEIEFYKESKGQLRHYFIGFNALNLAEQHIIQEMLETGNSEIFWDIDAHFYQNADHSASVFIREYLKDWSYYSRNPLPVFASNFSSEKNIQIISTTHGIQQVKYVSECLANMTAGALENTAIVLADESLLRPLIYSLPSQVKQVNITMGMALGEFETARFFAVLLKTKLKKGNYYHRDIAALLHHPLVNALLKSPQLLLEKMNLFNLSYLSEEKIISLANKHDHEVLQLLFGNWKSSSALALKSCLEIISKIDRSKLMHEAEWLAVQKLDLLFLELQSLTEKYSFLHDLSAFQSLFESQIDAMNIDFEGDAYGGLQIMGVLETRVLDFQNVFLLSVNEGQLPCGKSTNSYITADLKKQFSLPFYTNKDAIYAYHFYRLLQRAENITLLYSNQSKGVNTSEKSRFIMQLELQKLPAHRLQQLKLDFPVNTYKKTPLTINKTPHLIDRLKEIAQKGFSPSALTNYVRNPIDFYNNKILGIKEFEELEETVAYNTLGTVVHNCLENLYKPMEGKQLTVSFLKAIKEMVSSEIAKQFKLHYKEGDIERGKNLIILEVAKKYVTNLIELDLKELEAGNRIHIVALEKSLRVPFEASSLPFPVFLNGTVDRIDQYNSQLRIIDYKTGSVSPSELAISNWELLNTDYKFSKAYQVLLYAYMYCKTESRTELEAGIISFKSFSNGFMSFATKEHSRSKTKNVGVTSDNLKLLEQQLELLIHEICDLQTPFVEKEIETFAR